MEDRELFERRLGKVLRDKWTLEKLLGVGGMAAVYLGVHKIGRREAIKILHPEVARNRELCERFEREAHAVNHLKHPGAVEIRDVDVTEDGAPFLVMELLEGESLAERARRQNGVELGELLRLTDELLDVLAAAHAQGIVHRDIKLDNLFVQKDGRLKVLDFGIARMRFGASRMLTRTGARLGTVAYMPPEQVRGLEIDHRADLFAVGATMFRVIGRRRIHDAPSEPEMLVKMGTIPAPPLASVAQEAPHGVCLVVDRALAFHRERRYPDARTMQTDVQALRRGEDPSYASARLAAGDIPSSREPPPGAVDLSRPFDSGALGSSAVQTPAPHAMPGAAIEATVAHGARKAAVPTNANDPTRADVRTDPTRVPGASPLAASVPARQFPVDAPTAAAPSAGVPSLAGASPVGGTVVIGSMIGAPPSLPLNSTVPDAAAVRLPTPDTTMRSAVTGPGPVSVGGHSATTPSAYAPAAAAPHGGYDAPPSVAVISAPGITSQGFAAPLAAGARVAGSGKKSSPMPYILVGGLFLLVGASVGAWIALGSGNEAAAPTDEPQSGALLGTSDPTQGTPARATTPATARPKVGPTAATAGTTPPDTTGSPAPPPQSPAAPAGQPAASPPPRPAPQPVPLPAGGTPTTPTMGGKPVKVKGPKDKDNRGHGD